MTGLLHLDAVVLHLRVEDRLRDDDRLPDVVGDGIDVKLDAHPLVLREAERRRPERRPVLHDRDPVRRSRSRARETRRTRAPPFASRRLELVLPALPFGDAVVEDAERDLAGPRKRGCCPGSGSRSRSTSSREARGSSSFVSGGGWKIWARAFPAPSAPPGSPADARARHRLLRLFALRPSSLRPRGLRRPERNDQRSRDRCAPGGLDRATDRSRILSPPRLAPGRRRRARRRTSCKRSRPARSMWHTTGTRGATDAPCTSCRTRRRARSTSRKRGARRRATASRLVATVGPRRAARSGRRRLSPCS